MGLESNSSIEQFWISYIDALIKVQRFDDARQVVEEAKNNGVSAEKLNGLEKTTDAKLQDLKSPLFESDELSPAIDYRESGLYVEAEFWLKNFITTHPRYPNALSLLAQVLLLNK